MKSVKQEWNENADDYNDWSTLDADEKEQLYQARIETMERAMRGLAAQNDALKTGLVDWLNIYAPEFCDEARVKEARDRIQANGATLAYIAQLLDKKPEQYLAELDAAAGDGGEPPYIRSFKIEEVLEYNPKYGDNRICKCGHPYYRHFDPFEDDLAVGCKYCGCFTFREREA